MARKKSEKAKESGSFSKLLAWTVALGLVFSAGLITGQRILRQQAMPPMVSLSTTKAVELPAADEAEADSPLRTTFSFYEDLTRGEDSEARPPKAVEPVAAKAVEKAEAEPKPAETKPEAKPAEPKPVEAAPAEAAPEKAATPEPNAQKQEAGSTVGEAVQALQKVVGSITDEPAAEALPARYTLQVSSHPDRDSAEKELGRLRDGGVEPHIVVVDVPGKGQLYRIRVGKFHAMDEARSFQAAIKEKRGVAGFVTPL